MRSFRRLASGVSQAAAARCPDFSLAMASPSKKSLRAAERKRADVARARRRWIREQGFLDPARLVFIDETAVTTNMLRLNGWNPRGVRLVSDAPMGHWDTVTFIAGLRQTGVRHACAKLRSAQWKDCTDVFVRTFGRSILRNASVTSDIRAMNHYDREAL